MSIILDMKLKKPEPYPVGYGYFPDQIFQQGKAHFTDA